MKQFLAIISLIPLSLMSEPALETDELSKSDSDVGGEVSPVADKSSRINDATETIMREVSNLQQIRNNTAFQDSNPTIGLFKEGVHLKKALQFTNAGISDIRYLSETPENLSKVINYVNEGVLSPAQVEKFAGYCVNDEFGSTGDLAFEPGPGTLTDRRRSFVRVFEYGKALLEDNARYKTPEELIENFRPTNTVPLNDIGFEVYIRSILTEPLQFGTIYTPPTVESLNNNYLDEFLKLYNKYGGIDFNSEKLLIGENITGENTTSGILSVSLISIFNDFESRSLRHSTFSKASEQSKFRFDWLLL